jgi:tRNA(Ile)-lysidine synthase TilS/MesJ
LPFVYAEGLLGSYASEATARHARYDFLQKVAVASAADGIITAHHQDDVMETAIINLLRGTGRKGLTALSSQENLTRPIRHIPKADLITYANDQGLTWREDSTNKDETYLRNYVRQRLMTKFDHESRQRLLDIIDNTRTTNKQLDELLAEELALHSIEGNIDRRWFIQLPHDVAKEIMATWLRLQGVRSFDSKTLERLVVAAKVGRDNSQYDVMSGITMRLGIDNLALTGHER